MSRDYSIDSIESIDPDKIRKANSKAIEDTHGPIESRSSINIHDNN
jgi:hypothetical protein